jgi:hypothetical protein
MERKKLFAAAALAGIVVVIMVLSSLAGATAVGATGPTAAVSQAAPSVSWTTAQLRDAPTAAVVDNEPGIGHAGGIFAGPSKVAEVPILVTLAYSHPAQLSAFLSALSNPASPSYHQYMTASEFDAAFGGSPSVYSAALGYFASFGVTDVVTYADHASISFDATPAQVAGIFHSTLGAYTYEGRPYYAPIGTAALPTPLNQYVVGVSGLSDYSEYTMHTDSSAVTAQATTARTVASSTPGGALTPCQADGGPWTCTGVDGLSYPEPLPASAVTEFCGANQTGCSGQMLLGSEFQVAYNETNPNLPFKQTLFGQYGYPRGADIATILWTDPVENYTDPYCAAQNPNDYAWDFYGPAVSSYYQYTLPKGEPLPTATGVPIAGPAFYDHNDSGLSSSCDSGGAQLENTLDMDMEGVMAPGASVYQVFGQGPTSHTTNVAFADILSPAAKDGPGFTPSVVKGLKNVSVIANSWTDGNVNDTNWYSDLVQAQARGITVVGSSGDCGCKSLAAPAGQSYNTLGDVAIGGTTLTLNPTTLLRSPVTVGSNPYTVCTGTQVCGSELPWYAPVGTVNGFGETLGGAGGVDKAFAEPSWQKSSSDANKVITSVASGRGEPDFSAVANDTPITFAETGYYLNMTCFRLSSCGGPPGFVTGYVTYVVGTSISDQVAGGIIATIDHALWESSKPWLGFMDPTVYSWGQAQYNGKVALNPFFDVIFYHNKPYSALTGYDLATGWGVLDAGNYTQLAFVATPATGPSVGVTTTSVLAPPAMRSAGRRSEV